MPCDSRWNNRKPRAFRDDARVRVGSDGTLWPNPLVSALVLLAPAAVTAFTLLIKQRVAGASSISIGADQLLGSAIQGDSGRVPLAPHITHDSDATSESSGSQYCQLSRKVLTKEIEWELSWTVT
jgi:hypothetical protein